MGKSKTWACLLLVIVKILYIVTCSLLLSNDWHGFSFGFDYNLSRIWLEVIPFFIGLFIYLKFYQENVIGFFNTMVFTMAFIPANSGIVISNNQIVFYLLNQLYLLLFIYLCGRFSKEANDKSRQIGGIDLILSNRNHELYFRVSMILATVLIIIKVYIQTGLDFSNLIVGNMYDVRSVNTDFYSSHEGSFYAYFSIVADAAMCWLIPVYLFYAFTKKSVVDIVIAVFALLAEFSSSMMKGTLFVLVIICFALVLSKLHKERKASQFFLFGIIGLFIICLIEYSVSEFSFVFEVVIRRMFYMTQYMVSTHYDFFSTHDKFWFTHECFIVEKFVSHILNSSYHSGAIKIISDYCFDGAIPAPNAGMFAEAYAQIGALGAFVFPFVHVYIVKLVYKFSSWYGTGVSLVIMAKLFLRLSSVYILETGYLFGILLFVGVTFLLKRKIKRNSKKRGRIIRNNQLEINSVK